MLSGVSNSYIFYKGKQIAIEDIESYDISSRNISFRTSNTFLFINIFETTNILIEDNKGEQFKQIISGKFKNV